MKQRILKALLALALLSTWLPVQAEETGDVSFSAIGVNEQESSVHELYPEDGSTEAYVSLWKDETRVLKVRVSATHDMHVTVHTAPLTASKQETTVAVSAGLLKANSASLGMGTDASIPHTEVFDILSNATETDLQAGETAWFWVLLDAGDAESGSYRGEIAFEGTDTGTLKLEAVVSSYSVAEEAVSLNLWQYPFASYQYYGSLRGTEFLSEAHRAVLKKELELYKEAGGSHITCAITDEPWAHQTYPDTPSLVKWNLDGNGFLWFDYTLFDQWVELCDSVGIDGQIDCFSILPFDHAITVYSDLGEANRLVLTPGDETWRWYWENFLYSFINHLKEKGWLERTCLFVDERGLEYFSMMLDFVHAIPDGNQFRFGAALNVIPRDTALYDQFDYLSISIASVPENDPEFDAFLSHRSELGLTTTMYNCSTNYPNAFLYSDPCESVWTMLYLEARGFDGYLRWAFNAWPADPLRVGDNIHFEAGDTFLIYPDEMDAADPVPVRSLRYLMIQQGLNDIRKLRALSKRLDGETAGMLAEGLTSMARCYGTYNAYGAMTAISETNRRVIAGESLRMEALIQKAAVIAALQEQGRPVPSQLMEEPRTLAQYQPYE